jgi:DnaA family protein
LIARAAGHRPFDAHAPSAAAQRRPPGTGRRDRRDPGDDRPRRRKRAVTPPRQLVLDLLQPAAPTLENFVVGRNAEAVAVLRQFAGGAPSARIVYLWGEAGCGRSHLLQALASLPAARIWQPAEPPERAGLALADDVDRLDDAAQVALFNRLNAVRASVQASCVATGSLPPAQLPLREDLRTRLAWGLVYQLQPLTDAEKADALRAQAAARGLAMGPEVAEYLLRHLPRDMRTLSAAIEALDAYALAQRRSLTVPLVRQWLAADAP